MSRSCAPDTAESPRSIAAEPDRNCRSHVGTLRNSGSLCTPLASCRVPACMVASEVYEFLNTYSWPDFVNHTRLWATVVVVGAESQPPLFPARGAPAIPLYPE